jgi:ABC-2 type transport system ATP-binding protein
MVNSILQVEKMSLRYGSQDIIKEITFNIPKGKIVGLLGPNGAGKSSIIKVLAGLVYPKCGSLMFDNNVLSSFSELRRHCGFMINSPAYYPYLSARQNLNIINILSNKEISIDELLKKVGLEHTGKKKVNQFSTGMKQRLAIAQALLGNHKLLILDEPFNGLDPNGFMDLKMMLNELNDEGVTIFISSHLLDELEQFADLFILLNKGSIEFQISKDELLRSKKKVTFTFEKEISPEARAFINENQGDFEGTNKVTLRLNPDQIAEVVNRLVQHNSIPVNVETNTILQEKYFEIIK